MKINGFSFVRNGVKFDYPFLESILSILPICDEFVIAVGKSEDGTLEKIQSLHSSKIKIIETVWDETPRRHGTMLSQQTNIALEQVSGDWAFYLQADEVVHENDLPRIYECMERYQGDPHVEGLLFSYKHFYGSYDYVGTSRRWYQREIRVVRTGIGVRSWGDAQGFRIGNRKLRVKLIDASIYHYSWVKPPQVQQEKQKSFSKLWRSDEWIERNFGFTVTYDYSQGGKLVRFTGTHPAIMNKRMQARSWKFEYNPGNVQQPLKEKLLDWIELKTGIRIGEYRNYKLI